MSVCVCLCIMYYITKAAVHDLHYILCSVLHRLVLSVDYTALQHYRVGMHLILYNISIIIACHLPGTHAAVILVYKHSIHRWISNI